MILVNGLNSVTKVVMKLFDTGKISEDVMQELVKACREGVY